MSTALRTQLVNTLGLKQAPVSVHFRDSAPAGVPTFAGRVAGGCSFWELGAAGPIATSTKDHEACSIGVYTHNLPGATALHSSELTTVLKVMNDMEYATPKDVAGIPVLKHSPASVVYAPLGEGPGTPDVVVMFVNAAQSLIVAEAVSQVDEDVAPAMGRPACAAVPQAVASGRAAMSLGCCGARAYLDNWSDDVAMWALPGARIESYAKRIEVLAKANSVLGKFHELRREEIEAGARPTYAESMATLNAERGRS